MVYLFVSFIAGLQAYVIADLPLNQAFVIGFTLLFILFAIGDARQSLETKIQGLKGDISALNSSINAQNTYNGKQYAHTSVNQGQFFGTAYGTFPLEGQQYDGT